MIPLAAIGLGLQGAGLLGQLFGQSEASKRRAQEARNQEATRRTLAFLAQQRSRSLGEGVPLIARQAQGMIASGRSAAASRAAAAGRSGETESYMLPIEAKGAQAGNEAMTSFVRDTNRYYDQAGVNAQMSGLDQSLQPLPEAGNWSDYALPVGGALAKYGMLSQNQGVTDVTGGLPLATAQKPDITNPAPIGEDYGQAITPGTPFRMSTQAPVTNPDQVGFDFNQSGNKRLAAYRGLRRGSVFGY